MSSHTMANHTFWIPPEAIFFKQYGVFSGRIDENVGLHHIPVEMLMGINDA